MSVLELAVGGGLALYTLAGSASWGYIFFRTGWPKIRAIGLEYKTGWSIIIGGAYSVIVVLGSAIITFSGIGNMLFAEAIFVSSAIISTLGIVILTIKRKLLGKNKLRVSVPKRAIAANIVAAKAFKKLPENSYIKVSKEGTNKISQLKEKIEPKPEIKPTSTSTPASVTAKFSQEISQTPAVAINKKDENKKLKEEKIKTFEKISKGGFFKFLGKKVQPKEIVKPNEINQKIESKNILYGSSKPKRHSHILFSYQ